jgi:hypothetical protein
LSTAFACVLQIPATNGWLPPPFDDFLAASTRRDEYPSYSAHFDFFGLPTNRFDFALIFMEKLVP